jgi:hypothetical protein
VAVIALGIGSPDIVERPSGTMLPPIVPVAALFRSPVAIVRASLFKPPSLVSLTAPSPIPVSVVVPIALVAPVSAIAPIITVRPIPVIGTGAVGSGQ